MDRDFTTKIVLAQYIGRQGLVLEPLQLSGQPAEARQRLRL